MNFFLLGFGNSGKTTIFNLISKKIHSPSPLFSKNSEPIIGAGFAYDPRVKELKKIFPQKKENYTQVQIVDFNGILKDEKHNRNVLNYALKSDLLVYIIRGFEDENVETPLKEINPLREYKDLLEEILLNDYFLVETRLKNIKEMEKKGKKGDSKELDFLEKCRKLLEEQKPLIYLKEEKKKFPHLNFLSWLPFYVLINIDEGQEKNLIDLEEYLKKENIPYSLVYGKIEEEALELGEEGKEWLTSYGIKSFFKEWFLFEVLKKSKYIFFLTIGTDEIKSWAIQEGTNAYEAAGKVHTDIQKGFIKAEVLSFEEFLKYKDFHKAREAGVLKIEGKEYKIEDGNVIYFRFHKT